MFRVERFVKWRTRSISPTSGKGGGSLARADEGGRESAGPVGTSHSGRRWERRPGRLSSNSNSVDCGLSIVSVRILERWSGRPFLGPLYPSSIAVCREKAKRKGILVVPDLTTHLCYNPE